MTTRNELAEQRAKRLPADVRQLYEAFRRMGMAPAAALAATAGRDTLPSADKFEQLTESFERSGLSRTGAKIAAVGRHSTEHEVREALSKSEQESEPASPRAWSEHQQLIQISTDRYVREGMTPDDARRAAERLWSQDNSYPTRAKNSTELRESSVTKRNRRIADRARELVVMRGLDIRSAVDEAEREL